MNKQLEINSKEVHQLVSPQGERLSEFMDQTEAMLDIRFPNEYLSRGSVLSLVDQSQLVCGGAIVVLEPPFRSIDSIPGDCIDDVLSRMGVEFECAEINGVWLLPRMKSPYLSFALWRHLISHLVSTNKRRFLFTFDNSNGRMKEVSVWLRPEILYSGRTAKLAGMKSEGNETIAMVTRESLATVLEMLDRRGIGEAKAKEKKIIQQIERRGKSGCDENAGSVGSN